MKKSLTWSALLTLGLSTTVYLSPVQAAPEFSVELKNIHTRTEVLKGTAPAGSIIVLQADDTEEEDIQEVAHTKAKADGTYSLEMPEEALIGEDFNDFHESDNEDDEEDYEGEQSIPNYFLEVVSVDDYTGDDDGMDDDWGAYSAHASSYGDEGDEPGEGEDEPGEDDGDSDDGLTDPVSYDIDPIDLTAGLLFRNQLSSIRRQ